jgi:transcriptional regulator with XRE-family HTH domain
MKDKEEKLKEFGQFLFKQRMDRKMSLVDAGKCIGISANYLGELERGEKEPSDNVLRQIAECYEVPEESLFSILRRVPLGIKEEVEHSEELQALLEEIARNKDLSEETKRVLYRKVRCYFESLLNDL